MSREQLEVQAIAILAAIACALPGTFLVLRGMSLMSDAISHVVLLGIAIGYLLTRDLASPLLIIGAALTGVLAVSLVEMLTRTRLVKRDAAIGLVFPALFSIGVILISRNAGNVHLDVDIVLTGELAFAPFWRTTIAGLNAPRALWMMLGILVVNLVLLALFYKELKLATFDPGLAAALGFAPGLVHYLLMTSVSVTAVGAFEAVGSILVVALMIAPPATAFLLTHRLSAMLGLGAAVATLGAIGGYWASNLLDASIAGCMATMLGVLFAAAFAFAPGRGLLYQARRRARQRLEFAQKMLTIHLLHHEDSPEALEENRLPHLSEHLRWNASFAQRVVRQAEQRRLIRVDWQRAFLTLTEEGRDHARETMVR